MKQYKHLLASICVSILCTSCIKDYDAIIVEPKDYPYGNQAIGEANTTIQELKQSYKNVYLNSSYQLIEDDIRIRGRIITNDESGNVYKQLAIQDETGGIILGVNATGLYAYLPLGQEVVVDCKGLYIGGYGKLPQLGAPYDGKMGRMSEQTFKQHIRLIGKADRTAIDSIIPLKITEEWLAAKSHMDNYVPLYVQLNNVKFVDGGKDVFAPNDIYENIEVNIDGDTIKSGEQTTTFNRAVRVGKQEVVFRMSTYANFASQTMPKGKVNITGVITRYNDTWQCMLRVLDDIKPANSEK